jgi:hypothetical protein
MMYELLMLVTARCLARCCFGRIITNLHIMIVTETNQKIVANTYNIIGFVFKFCNVTQIKAIFSDSTQQSIEAKLTGGVGKQFVKVL